VTSAAIRTEPAVMLVVLGVAADACPRQSNFVGNCNFVTRGTLQVPMSARQRICGLRVMIELPTIPTVGVVAGAARFAERALVVVTIRVAIAAHLRHTGEVEFRMTRLARGRCMNADQRELRECVVERNRMPRHFGMATLTCAIPTAVRIVILVTTDTRLRQFVGQCAAMAAFTAQWFVCAFQCKACLRKVIVFGLPFRLAVAIRAFAAETAAMMIVGAVATVAVLRRLFDRHVVEVARAADELFVSAHQRKTGLFEMIERDPAPFDRVVARRAVRTATASVNVIGAMA
jgi:hypothetical protein